MLNCNSCGRIYEEKEFYCPDCRNVHALNLKLAEDFEICLSHDYLDILNYDGTYICRGVEDYSLCPEKIVIPGIVDIIYKDFFSNVPYQVSEVVVEEGVKLIDDRAFQYSRIKEIEIPGSVFHIGANSFENSDITSLKLNYGTQLIEDSAFKDCLYLTGIISIPGSVRKIGDSCFEESKIDGVILEYGIEEIGKYAFRGTNLGAIPLNIPGSVEVITESCFENAWIKELNLDEGIKFIGDAAFRNNMFESLTLPSSVVDIGDEAFTQNFVYNVQTMGTIDFISSSAFDEDVMIEGRKQDEEFTRTDVSYESDEDDGIDEEEIDDSSGLTLKELKEIRKMLGFSVDDEEDDEESLEHVNTIVNGITEKWSNENREIERLKQLEEQTVEGLIDHDYLLIVDEDGQRICKGFRRNLMEEPGRVVIPDDVEIIEYGAFSDKGIQDLILGKDVREIRDNAFKSHRIKSLIIPEKVRIIGRHAFSAGFEITLKEISFLTDDIHFGEYAFAGNGLEELEIPTGLVTFDMGAFSGNVLTEIHIPDNITSLSSALFGMNSLTKVSFGKGIRQIGRGAFMLNPITDVHVHQHNLSHIKNTFDGSVKITLLD